MKQISRLLLGGALVCGLWSCSNDNAPDGPGKAEPTLEGDGYLAINIQLPTEPSTRALNDNFDDGLATEYAVDNGVLLLFAGADENAATYQGAFMIPMTSKVDGTDQITTTYQEAIKISGINATGTLYGLVMVNYSGIGSLSGTSFTFTGDSAPLAATATLSTVRSKTAAVASATANNPFIYEKDNNKYFYMTNTVLCSAPGGKASPSAGTLSTLANLGTDLYPTKQQAITEAQSVFVERGVAKVTMNSTATELVLKEAEGNNPKVALTVNSVDFCLGNIEKSSYMVRDMDYAAANPAYLGYFSTLIPTTDTKATNQKYRFVGPGKMGESSLQPYVDYYRTYWCKDPNYDGAGKTYDAGLTAYANGNPLYCFENTFDVANQNLNNTTRAVIKVTFNGGDFYVINENRNTIYTEENFKSHIVSYISKNAQLQALVKETLKKTITEETTINYSDYFTVSYAEADAQNVVKVNGIKPNNLGEVATFTFENDLIAEVNNFETVEKYVGGVAYYDVLIKHFGDDLTPWEHKGDKEYDASTIEKAYGDPVNSQNYLGRYGMVRNNWYDLAISDIIKLGDPVAPAGGGIKPDDNNEPEKWIAFKVNILSWAKRTQGVVLGE